MEDTLLQFGRTAASAPRVSASDEAEARPLATVCPKCAQHFSADGRFCPFDGEPLGAALGWDAGIDPMLGTVVDGRYELRAVLGEGGMGIVYEARHCTLGKRFALKALRKYLASDAEIAARFMQEARIAASVSHPGLVEITDFGRFPTGQPFFVMELLEGQSLATLIRRGGPVPVARAVAILRQIAEALGTAHELSIVHRDLKPDNIHISSEGVAQDRVTIVDFGLAKVIGAGRLTRAGMVFGTPHYMSPEQAMGEATDHRTDVYALGVVMYEMFTGRLPFEADSYMGVLTKHIYMAPTPPSQFVVARDLGVLENITLRCLEKNPEHRYASLRELSRDLDLALNAANGTGERPSAARYGRAIPRSLLADELELPSREEMRLRPRRSRKNGELGLPLIIFAGLFLAGIAGMLALRTATLRSATHSHGAQQMTVRGSRLEGANETSKGRALNGAAVTASLPNVSSSDAPVAASAEAIPQAGSLPVSAAPQRVKVPPPAPRTPKVQGSLSASSPGPAPQKAARSGSSEIVDPWAK